MKALRYLLIVMMVSVASMVFATAQNLAQQPEARMQSTSIMAPSGSALPQAAVTGAVTTYSTNSAAKAPGRRNGLGGGGGSGEPGDRPEPWKDPIGDALWPLMLLACVYVLFIRVRMRKRA